MYDLLIEILCNGLEQEQKNNIRCWYEKERLKIRQSARKQDQALLLSQLEQAKNFYINQVDENKKLTKSIKELIDFLKDQKNFL